MLAPGPAFGRLQPGAADAFQGGLQPVFLLVQQLLRQLAVFVHAQMGVGQRACLLLAELVELADGVVCGQIQPGGVVRRRRWGFRDLLGHMLLFCQERFAGGLLFFGMEQKI